MKPAKYLYNMMTTRPTMIFGNFVEDNNNEKNIQPMSLISSSIISRSYDSRTRFIMSSRRLQDSPRLLTTEHLTFDSYYLPSKFNGYRCIDLGDDAEVFITDELSGCTVVISQLDDITRVYHFNVLDGNQVIDQQAIDEMIKNTLSEEEQENIILKLSKADYINSSRWTTLIGLRIQQQWSFHYQLHTETNCISYKTSFSTHSTFLTSDDELDDKRMLVDTINNNNEYSARFPC